MCFCFDRSAVPEGDLDCHFSWKRCFENCGTMSLLNRASGQFLAGVAVQRINLEKVGQDVIRIDLLIEKNPFIYLGLQRIQ